MTRLHIFLIHGTWAGSARWTHPGSDFRKDLKQALADVDDEVVFDPFPWDGHLKVRSRRRVMELLQEHVTVTIRNKDFGWRYLFVAHSHGGNIATDALRNLLEIDQYVPIEGVVCLNTPFYTHEVRGVNAYLVPWFLLGVFLSVMFWTNTLVDPSSSGICFIPHEILVPALYVITGGLALLCTIGKLFRPPPYRWGPKPDVLCLSCPDDEAITFLGLGEGISNLPQLFLHPIGLTAATILCGVLLHLNGVPTLCGTPHCWAQRLCGASEFFTLWVGLALAGGVLGASAVTVMFGLPIHLMLKTLVSRILVSYTPLSPANTFFRAIPVRLRFKPVQLFHSSIYYSGDTFKAIGAWLKRDKQQNV